jgi:hypothetical protein
MQHIDEARLEQELPYRFGYVSGFMGFTQADIDAVHAAAGALAPVVPGLVDAVYVQLFEYDCTKRHFVPRQAGFEGNTPESLAALTLDHEQIKFRKSHLANYLVKLVTAPYDEKLVGYLDLVGKIHTPGYGNPQINVPLVQMNALMGFVADALLATVYSLDLPADVALKTARAFNKLLWIQNDLITRHYAGK